MMRLFLLILLLCCTSWAKSQPDPEYNILFNVVYNDSILNDSNARFQYYRQCDKRKSRLKQPNYRKVVKLSSQDSRPFRTITVLHQYLDCQQVRIKVNHKGFSMNIILHTKGIFDFNLWGTYYIYQPLEFVPDKTVNIHFANSTPDEEMGDKAIGYSGSHFWVHPSIKQWEKYELKVKRNQFIDTIPLPGEWTLIRVSADSINPKFTIPTAEFFIQSFVFRSNGTCNITRSYGQLINPNSSHFVEEKGTYRVQNEAIRILISNLGYTPRGGADFYQIKKATDNTLQLVFNGGDELGLVVATFLRKMK